MNALNIMIQGILVFTLIGLTLQFVKGSLKQQPLIGLLIVLGILAFGFSLYHSLKSDGNYQTAFKNSLRLQDIKGTVIGNTLGESFPASRVMIVHPMQLTTEDNPRPVNDALAQSLARALQAHGCIIEERTLPTPKSIQQFFDHNSDKEQAALATEEALLNQTAHFIHWVTNLKDEADLVISLIEIPKILPFAFPAASESPSLVLFNCWLDDPEEVLQRTAVIGIVRTRDSIEIQPGLKRKPSEVFDQRFEFLFSQTER